MSLDSAFIIDYRGIIGEAVVAKTRHLKFREYKDPEYGTIKIIFSYIRSVYYEQWSASFGDDHDFDTLLVLCADRSLENIERVYAIPEEMLYANKWIIIMNGKWKKFEIDKMHYNKSFHNLIEFLKGNSINMEYIQKWLEQDSISS